MENLSFNELKNKLDEITIRYEMLNISQSFLNSEEIIKGILDYLKQFFMFEALSFYLRKGKDKKFNPYRTSDILFQELIQDNDLIKSVSDKSEILILSEGKKDQTLFKILAPINDGERPIGILIGLREKPFLKDEIFLFQIAAKQFAFIIQNVKAEERYRSVVENALDGVAVLDEDGRILYVNEKMTELIGCQREELIGKDFSQFIDEAGKEVLKSNISRRIDEEEGSLCYELSIIKRNGEIKNVEVSSTCIKDTEENPVIVAFIKDITEKKKLEVQLIQSEKLRAIAEMANGVAHDFN
ncbi:MAG: PAS domain S-box protein, partial [Bacteroidales bacterium]